MGVSLDLMGNYKDASQSYKKALELDQGLDYVHNNLGYSYALQGMNDEAIEEYRKAIELNPTKDKYHNNLGKAYAQKGSYEVALAEFENTMGKAGAHGMLAKILYKKGLYDEAKVQFAAASRLNPDAVDLINGLNASTKLAKINKQEEANLKKQSVNLMTPSYEEIQITSNDIVKSALVSSGKFSVKYISLNGAPIVRGKITKDQPVETVTTQKVKDAMAEQTILSPEDQIPGIIEKAASTAAANSADGTLKDKPVIASLVPSTDDISLQKGIEVYPAAVGGKADNSSRKGIEGMVVQLISDFPNHPVLKKVTTRLIKIGFKVEQIENDGRFGHSETKLYYCVEHLQEAYQAAKQVPGWQNMDGLNCYLGEVQKIQVVIGGDLIQTNQAMADKVQTNKSWEKS
jgi:TPR repeat/Tetratricopeptide repeat